MTRELLAEQKDRVASIAWRQFHANLSGAGAAAWLPVGAWSACRSDYEVEDGEVVTLGIDIGGGDVEVKVLAWI